MNDTKSLSEKFDDINARFDQLTGHLQEKDLKKVKEWKLPFGIRFKTKSAVKKGKFLVIFIKNNKAIEFKYLNEVGGIIQIDQYKFYAFQADAIHLYKNIPVLLVFEWRLTPVGSSIDEFRSRLLGGEEEKELASKYNMTTEAQLAIIRAIEKAEIEKAEKKKMKFSPILLIIGAVIVLGVLAQQGGLF